MSGLDAQVPAEPRPASTVILLRERAGRRSAEPREGDGFEVFLVQRHAALGFMGGLHVFPGGKVCETDGDARVLSRVDSTGAALGSWGDDVDAQRAVLLAVAAIRETFEEAGVLLCERAHELGEQELGALRARLLSGEPLGVLLEEHALLRLRLCELAPLARWITPATEPVRFDTCFYLARAPHSQHAQHDAHETVAGCWLTPRGALAAAERGEIRFAPPTSHTLAELSALPSLDAAFAFARSREVPVVLPVLKEISGELWVLYPGDPEHPEARRALPGPTRFALKRL